MDDNAQLHSNLVESIQGMEIIKAYNAKHKAKRETEKKFLKLLQSVFKFGFMSNMQSSLQSAIVAADRLGEILDLQPERQQIEDKKTIPLSLKGSIQLNDINFRYGTRGLSLNNIQVSIATGEKVAFVGESGSGKTTLIKLILKFYKPEKGDILINGTNIEDINVDALRRKIGFIPQKSSFLVVRSVIIYGLGISDDIDLDIIIEATKKVKAHDFIHELPLQYNTLLAEKSSKLSEGQKQRLAIARALLKNPDILIMDEATSNLDSITERALYRKLYLICIRLRPLSSHIV